MEEALPTLLPDAQEAERERLIAQQRAVFGAKKIDNEGRDFPSEMPPGLWDQIKGGIGGTIGLPTLFQDREALESLDRKEGESLEEYKIRVRQGITYDDRPEALTGRMLEPSGDVNRNVGYQFEASVSEQIWAIKEGIKDTASYLPFVLSDRQLGYMLGEQTYFAANPDFNVVETVKQFGDQVDYVELSGAQSLGEYFYLKEALGKHKQRQQRLVRTQEAYAVGHFLAMPLRISSLLTVGTIPGAVKGVGSRMGSPSFGIKDVSPFKAGARAAGAGYVEETIIGAKDEFLGRDALGYATNVFFSSLGVAGVLTGLNGIKAIRRKNGNFSTLDDMIDEEAVIDVELKANAEGRWAFKDPEAARKKGATLTLDDFVPEDPDSLSVGASASPGSQARLIREQADFAQNIYDEGLANSMGLAEATSFANPILRLLESKSIESRQLVQGLVDVAVRINKNYKGMATTQSLETIIRRKRQKAEGELTEGLSGIFVDHLTTQGVGPNSAALHNRIGTKPTGFGGVKLMSRNEFNQNITRSLRNGGDSGSPEIKRATALVRKFYDSYLDRALDTGIFTDFQRRRLRDSSLKAPEIAILNKQISDIETKIRNNKDFYVNQVWDESQINSRWDQFIAAIELDQKLSRKDALVLGNKLRAQRPFVHTDDLETGVASPLHERLIVLSENSPLEDFLVNDISVLTSTYARTFGADLEIYDMFGSVDLLKYDINTGEMGPITRILDDYNLKIAELQKVPGNHKAVTDLEKARDVDVGDVTALRDLLRWTYSIPANPNSRVSSGIRMAKNFAAMTSLTGALAAIPDMARVLTVDGLSRSFKRSFEGLINGMALLKMSKLDARAAGEVWEMALSTRAAMMADLGNIHGIGHNSERMIAGATSAGFVLNGMNLWNDVMKNIAGLNSGSRMLKDIEDIMTAEADLGDVYRLGIKNLAEKRTRLADAGIDEAGMESIWSERANWHRSEHNIIAQTDTWKNLSAQDTYLNALSKEIQRVIITPGLGEKPLFTSNEVWSLVTQFKSFAFSSHMKASIPMMQQRDFNMLTQLAGMVALGGIVAAIRSEQLSSNRKFGLTEFLLEGFDRSGAGFWAMDLAKGASRIGGFGDFAPSELSVAGQLLGPAASQGLRAVKLLSDRVKSSSEGNFSASHWEQVNARRLLPYNNFAHLDFLYDQVQDNIP